MKINVRELTESKEVLNACRVTVWKGNLDKEPSFKFLDDIYMSEHSPIRDKMFVIEVEGIKSWLATHFARHHVGATPYVATQRNDRLESDIDRDKRGQGELVNMRITLNAQSIIDISRKRLCGQAHIEATAFWSKVLKHIQVLEPTLYSKCVPNCVYRGFCGEASKCRYNWDALKVWRKKYLSGRDSL